MVDDATIRESESSTDLDLTRGQAVSWIVGFGGVAVGVGVAFVPLFWVRPDRDLNQIGLTVLTASVVLLFLGFYVSRCRQESSWRSRWSMFRSLGYLGSRWGFRDQTEQAAHRLGLDRRTVLRTLQVLFILAAAAFVVAALRLMSMPRPR